jgi:hypothetical protein
MGKLGDRHGDLEGTAMPMPMPIHGRHRIILVHVVKGLGETTIGLTRKVKFVDGVAPGHGCRALDTILQFAHVARPVTIHQHIEGFLRDSQLTTVVLVVAVKEVGNQRRDVLSTFPQGAGIGSRH